MSGSYVDIPSHRFNLGNDGSVALGTYGSAAAWVDYTSGLTGSSMVDSSVLGSVPCPIAGNTTMCIVFPEPRTIKGVMWTAEYNGTNGLSARSVQYSTDTVDGIGGTWTSLGDIGYVNAAPGAVINPIPAFRTSIAAVNLTGVKAMRFVGTGQTGFNNTYRNIHIYGTRPTTSVDRLAFWDPTTDTEIAGAFFDFGDVNRAGGATASKQFRIKNLSATKNATGLVVTASDLTGSPFGASKLQVSTDNATWVTATAGFSLAANTISSIMYCRLNPDATLVTQVRAGRLTTSTSTYA